MEPINNGFEGFEVITVVQRTIPLLCDTTQGLCAIRSRRRVPMWRRHLQASKRLIRPLSKTTTDTIPTDRTLHEGSEMFRISGTAQLKCDGTRAETTFRLSAKWTSPFKSAGGVSSFDYRQPRCAYQR